MAKITEEQLKKACELAIEVYEKTVSRKDAVSILHHQFSLNEASANDFISDFNYLMQGKVFHRAMSADAMRYFFEQIGMNFGRKGLNAAVISLKAHIEYYENHYKVTTHKMREVLYSFERATKEDLLPESLDFQQAVNESLALTEVERAKRMANKDPIPKKILKPTYVYSRSADVVATVLLRANGICEKCKTKAPFFRARDNTPYLEVHHKIQLADNGEDTVENTIAICPNCHRELHFGNSKFYQ